MSNKPKYPQPQFTLPDTLEESNKKLETALWLLTGVRDILRLDVNPRRKEKGQPLYLTVPDSFRKLLSTLSPERISEHIENIKRVEIGNITLDSIHVSWLLDKMEDVPWRDPYICSECGEPYHWHNCPTD